MLGEINSFCTGDEKMGGEMNGTLRYTLPKKVQEMENWRTNELYSWVQGMKKW